MTFTLKAPKGQGEKGPHLTYFWFTKVKLQFSATSSVVSLTNLYLLFRRILFVTDMEALRCLPDENLGMH